ncbi:MAG: hypothetical protein C0399_07730 [Syntrophus sp. (in: bacteria)]|nr:hypothetical protein [Syntrophus sp. (in: bacteria)]
MMGQLFKFFLSFLGIMAAGPLLFLLANFIWREQIDRFFQSHSIAISAIIALYVFFVSWMFFQLQDIFMVFPPKPGTVPVSKQELFSRLEQAFGKPVNGNVLFDFMKSDDKAVITWSSSVSYFQGTSGGVSGMKRVIVLTPDEGRHDVFFIMKNKDWHWNLSRNFTEFSLTYNVELAAEFRTEAYPSIEFGEHGLRVDIKKLTYNSDELWQPIQSVVLSSGWGLRGGLLPYFYQRITLCTTLALLIFLLLSGIMVGLKKPAAATTRSGKTPSSDTSQWKQPDRNEIEVQFQKAAANMSTPQIRGMIETHMRIPAQYLKGDQAVVFSVYSKAYLARSDKDNAFAAVLRKFAEEHHL